ncbi:MAG: DUF3108 domain-containing protein [Moraxellaceae bacterium]|nr:DUF3108 domain-containing protein [Moraxellaceae bacterium]MDZ4385964.1 DUF3108 domain-containing protein [Moraxellaceae bacterium]
MSWSAFILNTTLRPLRCATLLLPLLLLTACETLPAASATSQQLAATPVETRSNPLPEDAHRYRFSWDGNLSGTAERRLSCQSSQCEFKMEASVPGLASLTESSRFNWQKGQAQFSHYERRLQLLFFPQVLSIHRPESGPIRVNRRGKASSYENMPNLLDAMGLELQLRADLLQKGKPAQAYLLADSRDIREVRIVEKAAQNIKVAGQDIQARVFTTTSDGNGRTTTIWLDPKQEFLPLQITHVDGKETYRLEWLGDL